MYLQSLFTTPLSTAQLLANLRTRLEPMEQKSAYISAHMPDLAAEIIANADQACMGMLQLPGTGGVREFVGNPPCWLERRHNDNEFLWQLNRMTHWQELLEAYSLTKEKKYAEKVISELLDWIDTVNITDEMYDYPLSYYHECNPMRALELGIRNYKIWPLVLEHLGNTEFFTEEILEKYLICVYRQIRILRKVSPQIWPNADHNHFLMECLGILTTALYFPELKEAAEWKSFAIDGIERCAKAQLTTDGGQIEGCPSYHNGCMFWFGLAVVLAKRFGFSFSDSYMECFCSNLDYSIYTLRPTGKCVPVGDSHANNLAAMGAVYGYFALNDLTWLGLCMNLIPAKEVFHEASKHTWRALNPEQFYTDLKSLQQQIYPCGLKTTFWNRTLGQAIVRSGWTKQDLSFLMTCRSPVQNGHAHIDLMSFDFTALGKNMVCDPGIFCYRDDQDRRDFKSTAYHSTITIDKKNQFEYIDSFRFGKQEFGEIYNVQQRSFYSVASAVHQNYQPVTHQRHICLVDDSFLLVADRLQQLDNNEIDRYYHIDFTAVSTQPNGVVATDETANLVIYSFPQEPVSLLAGRLSDSNDVARPSTRVCFSGKYSGAKTYLTVLLPFRQKEVPTVSISQLTETTYTLICGSTYQIELTEEDIILKK